MFAILNLHAAFQKQLWMTVHALRWLMVDCFHLSQVSCQWYF